ncbi:MAG: ABC-2 family transporter [Planctomycetota bacterium]|nr:MAG: ABC-2 family transporter [Planctomycetota bacterium]
MIREPSSLAIRGPHLAFELARLARAPRPHLVRMLFVAVLLAFAAVIWPWNAAGKQEMLSSSSEIFKVFFQAEMLLAIFVVPALVAPAIPAEREAGTLDLLVTCPEPEGRLVLGKLASHAILVIAVLAAGFPFAFASVLLGGVPLERAASACVHIVMTATFAACIAVRCSLKWGSAVAATAAAVGTHVAIVFVSFAIFGAIGIVLATGSAFPVGVLATGIGFFLWLRWKWTDELPKGCIFVAIVILVAAAFAFGINSHRHSRGWDWVLQAGCPWFAYTQDALGSLPLKGTTVALVWIVHAAACIAVLAGTARRGTSDSLLMGTRAAEADRQWRVEHFTSFWRERQRREDEARGIEPDRGAVKLVLHPRADITNPTKTNPFLPVGRDPVYWMETSWPRQPGLNRLRTAASVGAWLVALGAIVLEAAGRDDREERLDVQLSVVMVTIVALAAGSATLSKERADGTLPVLLSTGYPALRIVTGKARAALRWCLPVFIPVALQLAAIILSIGPRGAGIAFVVAATALASMGLAIGTSACTRQPRLAFAAAVGALITLWFVPGIVASQWPEALPLQALSPFTVLEHLRWPRIQQFGHYVLDPLLLFAGATLACAVLPPVAASLLLEKQVRR